MSYLGKKSFLSIGISLLTLLAILIFYNQPYQYEYDQIHNQGKKSSFIVQGKNLNSVIQVVNSIGGDITHELPIINAVGTHLDALQQQTLLQHPEIRAIYQDRAIRSDLSFDKINSKSDENADLNPDLTYLDRIQVNELHEMGIDGRGVTIAIIDTGLHKKFKDLKKNIYNEKRVLAQYDAIKDKENKGTEDESGHGTHIASLAISSQWRDEQQQYAGIAPNANLVSVKAFNADGAGTYLDVIRALDWVVSHRDEHQISILNLSFSAPPQSFYWDDPLNQAVMVAWQAGIVVVASAGNSGPDAMTIDAPGNIPYVITVGAMTDNKTPETVDDDPLASFSSTGPTLEGFVKPEIVAPGGRLLGLMHKNSQIGKDHSYNFFSKNEFVMSGTSQSAAVVSGAIALMLQVDDSLTPDTVKCRLMATAQPAAESEESLGYTIYQQGSGLINALQAVESLEDNCANVGLDIDLDLQGIQHYAGPARRDMDGNFFIVDSDDHLWDGEFIFGDGYMWRRRSFWESSSTWRTSSSWGDGYIWENGSLWKDGYLWQDGVIWHESVAWEDGYMWRRRSLDYATNINQWVE